MKTLVSFLNVGLVACGWIYGSENVQILASIFMWVVGGLLIVLSLVGSTVFKFINSVDGLPADEDFLNRSLVKNPAMQVLIFGLAIFNSWLAFQNDYVVTSVVYGAGQVMAFMFINFVKNKMLGDQQ